MNEFLYKTDGQNGPTFRNMHTQVCLHVSVFHLADSQLLQDNYLIHPSSQYHMRELELLQWRLLQVNFERQDRQQVN